MKSTTIQQILTPTELRRAATLYSELRDTGTFAHTLDREIITPNIERINKALGQENDPRYLAYMIEAVLMSASRQA